MTVLWTEQDLCRVFGQEMTSPIRATGVSIDTRSLVKGDLFIALAGETHDGHSHVQAAFDKGAAACLVHKEVTGAPGPLIRVDDTLHALEALAQAARARFKGRMIAVTGSVGKTTTKNMLAAAFASQGQTHAADRSFNNHIGVPLTLARLPPHATWCVCEIGMNHAGEVAPLAKLVQPDVAIVTAVGNSHIGNLGSRDAIAEEKAELFSGLRNNGAAIVPNDIYGFEILQAAAQRQGARFISVGMRGQSDHPLADVHTDRDGSRFTFDGRHVTVRVTGHHMVTDTALALAATQAAGGRLDAAISALASFETEAGRGRACGLYDDTVALLDESYNASSLSMLAALDILALWPAKRRIAVLGDMLEMGSFAEEAHLDLLSHVIASADRVFCCGNHMKRLFDRLPDVKKAAWRETAGALAPLVSGELKAGDVILVKGSYASRMRDVVSALKKQGIEG